jgi:DNA-binding MarR family transcriptional regulator
LVQTVFYGWIQLDFGGKEAMAGELTHLDVLKKLRVVIRAAQRHSAWVEKQCGISGAQLWVMQEVHDAPGARVGEIASRLAIHQTTMSNLLNGLVRHGYIMKGRDENDQRVVKLALSEEGRRLLEQAPKPARGLLPEALLQMDREALVELNRGLCHLTDSIDSMDEEYSMQPLSFTM